MEIIRKQVDDENSDLWHFKIGGIAADGSYRLADLSREQDPETWLIENQAEAQTLIDAGYYQKDFAVKKVDFEGLAEQVEDEIEWLGTAIPLIPTADFNQLRSGLERMARQNRAMLRAWRYVLLKMN